MYECWGLVEGEWIKGFEVGVDSKTGLYVFFNERQRYYLKESELFYGKEKPE